MVEFDSQGYNVYIRPPERQIPGLAVGNFIWTDKHELKRGTGPGLETIFCTIDLDTIYMSRGQFVDCFVDCSNGERANYARKGNKLTFIYWSRDAESLMREKVREYAEGVAKDL